MYTREITIQPASLQDIGDFHRNNPIFNTLNIPVLPSDVTAYLAVKSINDSIPSHEVVTQVTSTIHNPDGTVTVTVNILD